MSNWNPLELAKTSKTFCIFPWIHQYVGPSGDVKPCCVYDYSSELGSLKENTLQEIWNNEKTKEMRLQFLKGEMNEGCTLCNSRIELNDQFYKLFNEKFFDENEKIQNIVADTQQDGSVKEHKLFYIDVRFNNLCNLKCRMCAPHYSTSWFSDHKKLYDLKHAKETNNSSYRYAGKTETQALEEIIPHLSHAEIIYFAGGEPLLQKEHYEVLNKLIELNKFDIEIRYNTNFNNLKIKDYPNVLEYWKKFNNVIVNASLDATDDRAEFWRSGTNWKNVIENRKMLTKECPNVTFNITLTLSWVNAYNLVSFHKEWVTLGYVLPENFLINPLDTPSYYCLKNIPLWKKQKIEELFLNHIKWLETHNCHRSIYRYKTIIEFMYSDVSAKPIDESLKMFSKITKKLDSIRGESFFDVFTEHKDLHEYIIENNLDDEFDY